MLISLTLIREFREVRDPGTFGLKGSPIYLEPGDVRYLIYWLAWELGSKNLCQLASINIYLPKDLGPSNGRV